MGKIRRLRQGLCIPVICAALSACGAAPDADALLVSGKKYLEAGDVRAAAIQFKNVLQQRPDSAEARYLLGRALLDNGEPAAGRIELRKALALKAPPAQVEPLIARSLLMEGQPRALIERYAKVGLGEPRADAELQTLLAHAHLAVGEPQPAQAALRAALAHDPRHAEALLLEARQMAARRQFDTAFERIEALLAREPGLARAWHLKGDLLLFAREDAPAALEAYRRAISLKPDLIEAHAALVSVALDRGERQAAEARLAQMRERFPGHPQTLYHEARHALLEGDDPRLKEAVRGLLERAPDSPKALQLAGLAAYRGGALPQAEAHLARALQLEPELPLARRVLARTHLRRGQPDQALALVQPAIERGDADAALLSLAAEALLLRGEAERAEALYARAARLDPRDARSRTALALTRLARGESEAAFDELERIAATDDGTTGDLALISAQLRRKQPQAALKSVERLGRKLPGHPIVPHLRGMAQLGLAAPAQARGSFEQALAIDAAYLPAAAALARLDLADGAPQQARQRFERVLAADPRSVSASMAIVELSMRAGAGAGEIDALLLDAVQRHPSEERPRLALVESRLRRKDAPQALRAARQAVAALPASLPLQDALGQALLASDEHQQAISTFARLAAQQPGSARAQLRLAGAHLAAAERGAAEESLRRALALEPASQEARQQLAGLYLATGRPGEALALAREMRKQPGSEAPGFQLEGDIEAAGRRWDAAAAAYRAGLKASPSGLLAARLHGVLVESGAQPQAGRFADDWVRAHPQDVAFRLHLGSQAMARQDHAQAERHFLDVLRLQPDHAMALNNLAWALLKQGKPGATAHAEKAHRLQPGQAAILDTLAQALAQERQWERAIGFQKKAAELDPRNPALRLGLARLYLASGRKERARDELDRLRLQGREFDGAAEVEQLLRSL